MSENKSEKPTLGSLPADVLRHINGFVSIPPVNKQVAALNLFFDSKIQDQNFYEREFSVSKSFLETFGHLERDDKGESGKGLQQLYILYTIAQWMVKKDSRRYSSVADVVRSLRRRNSWETVDDIIRMVYRAVHRENLAKETLTEAKKALKSASAATRVELEAQVKTAEADLEKVAGLGGWLSHLIIQSDFLRAKLPLEEQINLENVKATTSVFKSIFQGLFGLMYSIFTLIFSAWIILPLFVLTLYVSGAAFWGVILLPYLVGALIDTFRMGVFYRDSRPGRQSLLINILFWPIVYLLYLARAVYFAAKYGRAALTRSAQWGFLKDVYATSINPFKASAQRFEQEGSLTAIARSFDKKYGPLLQNIRKQEASKPSAIKDFAQSSQQVQVRIEPSLSADAAGLGLVARDSVDAGDNKGAVEFQLRARHSRCSSFFGEKEETQPLLGVQPEDFEMQDIQNASQAPRGDSLKSK